VTSGHDQSSVKALLPTRPHPSLGLGVGLRSPDPCADHRLVPEESQAPRLAPSISGFGQMSPSAEGCQSPRDVSDSGALDDGADTALRWRLGFQSLRAALATCSVKPAQRSPSGTPWESSTQRTDLTSTFCHRPHAGGSGYLPRSACVGAMARSATFPRAQDSRPEYPSEVVGSAPRSRRGLRELP
jgi:hypothetical protein